uniref:SBP-type domain-containing protein n=1 Tax=Oryza nivara TaxID=4536 RepID=A0A0E0J262_ORYNI
MEWAAAATKAASWGMAVAAAAAAADDAGPTMLSFAGPSSSSSSPDAAAAAAAAAALHDFSVRARPAAAAPATRRALGRRVPVGPQPVPRLPPPPQGLRGPRQDAGGRRRRPGAALLPAMQPYRFSVHVLNMLRAIFHNLAEFDDGKKSCRKRLDGHNRRRRKPQHDALNPRSFLPYHQANQFSVYPQTFPIADQNADALMRPLDRHPPFSISFSGTFREPKQFPFMQDGGSGLGAARHDLLRPFSSPEDGANITTTRSACNGVPHGLDPECALSLLSSSLHPSPAAGISSATAPPQFAPSSFSRIAASSQAVTTAFASDGGSVAGDHVLVPAVTYEDPSQAMPFSWQV